MKLRWPFVLRSTHERELAAAEAERQNDLRAAVSTIEREILKERTRCASIARGAPTASRGGYVRDHILIGSEDAPQPRASHPDLVKEAPRGA